MFTLNLQSAKDVARAQTDEQYLNKFIEKNRKFILSSASRSVNHYVSESDDEWSVALIAFHEALKSYDSGKGNFHAFASVVIRRRLMDHLRSESRHANEISVEPSLMNGDSANSEEPSILESEIRKKEAELSAREDSLTGGMLQSPVKSEIEEAQQLLKGYGFSFFDLAGCSPKTNKTKAGCAMAVQVLLHDASLLSTMRREKKLPAGEILKKTKVQKKLLERHRKYIIAAAEILSGDFPQLAEYMAYIRLIQE